MDIVPSKSNLLFMFGISDHHLGMAFGRAYLSNKQLIRKYMTMCQMGDERLIGAIRNWLYEFVSDVEEVGSLECFRVTARDSMIFLRLACLGRDVAVGDVKQFYEAVGGIRTDALVFATTTMLDYKASDYARKFGISIIDGYDLVGFLARSLEPQH